MDAKSYLDPGNLGDQYSLQLTMVSMLMAYIDFPELKGHK